MLRPSQRLHVIPGARVTAAPAFLRRRDDLANATRRRRMESVFNVGLVVVFVLFVVTLAAHT